MDYLLFSTSWWILRYPRFHTEACELGNDAKMILSGEGVDREDFSLGCSDGRNTSRDIDKHLSDFLKTCKNEGKSIWLPNK